MRFSLQHCLEQLEGCIDKSTEEFWRERLKESARALVEQCCLIACDRVGGDVVCTHCDRKYYDHPEIMSGFHWLCDGRLGKT